MQALTPWLVAVPKNDPFRQLHGLAETCSLFEYRMENDRPLARMMFSAVHGIISLRLEERMVAVPSEK